MRLLTGLLLFVLVCCFFSSCKPDDEKLNMSPSVKLSFKRYEPSCNCKVTADDVLFDTVFTQTGSVTKRLWVYNNDRNAVNIERIELARASGNQYSLFINGQETSSTTNVRLRGEDSLQILIKVKITPDDQNQPFLLTDSIRFVTNGNLQDVDLVAYGQNAYFHNFSSDSIATLSGCPGEIVWDSLKPHVIYGYVGVPQGCTLKILEGVRVYAHANSGIVVGGTLIVDGKANAWVKFQGDRRESRFENRPGQWAGIIFAQGLQTVSRITYADIKNAVYGVYIGSPDNDNIFDLVLEQCTMRNMLGYGLVAFTSDVRAVNCLFSNAGESAVATFIGGTYEFIHCTITNYGTFFNHDKPTARFETRTKLSTFQEAALNLKLINSIIWGTIPDEVLFAPGVTEPTNLTLFNNIVRTVEHLPQFAGNGNQVSQVPDYPQFKFPGRNFEPDSSTSPAVAAGLLLSPPVTADVRGNERPVPAGTLPDIGAFEVQQQP